jgi:hypothetical protein
MGPRASLDAVSKRKIPSPSGILTPIIGSSSPYSVAIPTELSWLWWWWWWW